MTGFWTHPNVALDLNTVMFVPIARARAFLGRDGGDRLRLRCDSWRVEVFRNWWDMRTSETWLAKDWGRSGRVHAKRKCCSAELKVELSMGRILSYALILVGIVIVGSIWWLYTPDEPRELLTEEYAQPPSAFIDVAGIRLHVRDTGPRGAPAIILLHGFGGSLQTWDDWARDLETDRRVIRYDLPGFGLTGADPSGDYTDARSIIVLLALMDRLGVARTSVLGHSMGGRIAWTFAALHPDRVDKLVLVSPDGFASGGLKYGVAPTVPLMMRALPYVLPTFMLRASLASAFANADTMNDALFKHYRDMMLAPGVRRAIVRRMGQQVLVDPVPLLSRISAPTLLMWGEKDGMIPIANSADYLNALPHGTLKALPGIGHIPQEEAPGPTVSILRQFLAR